MANTREDIVMGEASSPSVKQQKVDSLNIQELKELNIPALGQVAKDSVSYTHLRAHET